jgi:hypothetical protein
MRVIELKGITLALEAHSAIGEDRTTYSKMYMYICCAYDHVPGTLLDPPRINVVVTELWDRLG